MSTHFARVPPALVPLVVFAGLGCSHATPARTAATATTGDADPACFTAEADGAEPSQSVFDELGRSGNGPTWNALLVHQLERIVELGEVVDVPAMGFGVQFEVEYDGRTSWIGFDEEGGGATFCSGDVELLERLQSIHAHLRVDPDALRAAVRAVPDERWDD